MSGPQGPDPTQPWQGSQPPSDPAAWQQPSAPAEPTADAQGWAQQPAYNPQPQYPGYQQPAAPSYPPAQGYPAADQYGQQPTAYGPTSYAQPGQYGQQPTQYGQPQYAQPGQYGQPQYGQYPGAPGVPGAEGQQFSPYGATGPEAQSKKSMGLLLGIGGAVVALIVIVLAVTAFWLPGWAVSKELDVKAAQTGVQQILSDSENGYGAKNVENVVCNGGKNPPVEKGGTFTCDVDVDGTKREVTVTFQNNDGTYEVGRPR
jgi:hypothetical protein